MKHSRRMLLVPEEMMNLIYQKTNLETSPLVRSMSALNQQIDRNLDDANLSSEVKLKNHEQHFRRFLNLQDKKESYIPKVQIHPGTTTPPMVTQEPQQKLTQEQPQVAQPPPTVLDQQIIKSIPKRFQNQAEGLLEWIRKSPEAITWDERGVVSLEGRPIRGSSITDLMSDIVRTRKGFLPTGRDEFTKVLAKLNTPEDFVRNEDRRKLISLYKAGLPATPSFYDSPPSTPPSPPHKRVPQRRRSKVSSKGKRGLEWMPYD